MPSNLDHFNSSNMDHPGIYHNVSTFSIPVNSHTGNILNVGSKMGHPEAGLSQWM